MAERKPLVVLDSNIITELPVGDTLPGAFVDAPSDGQQYARQNGGWEIVMGGGASDMRLKHQVFTASGTFTLPLTAQPVVEYDVIGGGGGGSKTTGGGAAAGGGGGGGRLRGRLVLTPGDSYSVIVGAGGAGATVPATPGGDGGYSEIAGLVRAEGGAGGGAGVSNSSALGGRSGNGIPATAALPSSLALPAAQLVQHAVEADSAPGGSVLYVTGVSPTYLIVPPGVGRDGVCSGGGAAYSANGSIAPPGAGNGVASNANADATAPGCGGGAKHSGSGQAGNGFRGEVRITYLDAAP